MIVTEDPGFEKAVFAEGSPIAVPVQLTVPADGGEMKILAFSGAAEICRRFEELYASDPLSEEAIAFLCRELSPVYAPFGYDEIDGEDYPLFDFRPGEGYTPLPAPDCEIVPTLDGERWDEDLPLDEFRLDPGDPLDRMAVVRDGDGRIVCFAGLNDISEDEGFCELSVECAPAFRGRGFGPACASQLTAYLLARGAKVQYVTSCRNEESVRCAEKAGFTLANAVYPIVFRKSGEDDAAFFDFT